MTRARIGDVAEILLDYFEHNRTFQGDKIMTVPAATFTDGHQWSAEIELIFKRLPLMLALSCEMPKPGDYKTMEVVGLPILIVRDQLGKVRTFLNVCAHRWAPVATAAYGNCSRFICPFHGWNYGTDGRLIGVADQAKFGDLDRSVHGLKQLPCEERHGMIFACLTAGAALDLDDYYGNLLEEYEFAGLQHWTLLGRRETDGANWKITMGNFFETYHFAKAHANTVAKVFVSNRSHYEGFGPNLRIALLRHSIANLRNVPRAHWGEQEGQDFGFIRYFFPNVSGYIASGSDMSLFTQTFPGASPDTSRTVSLYLRKDPPRDEAERESIEKTISHANVDVGYNEDRVIGLQIQKGLRSAAHPGLMFGRNERGNQYFQEWLDWYLAADATRPKPVL